MPAPARRLSFGIKTSRRLWTAADPYDFEGRHYHLRGAIGEPKPVQQPGPPILIGAAGEQLSLRVLAEHADIWNCPTPTVEEFRGKSAVLDEHCRAIGRDPAEVVRSKQLIVSADDPAAKRGQVLGFVDAGLTHVVLAGAGVTPAWLAEEIAQPILARVA